ncbi:MAG TPA: radical SAM protein [Herpetosiphonaceae bacterium]
MNRLTAVSSIVPLQGLSFLWLEITTKCNLECVHCYADAGPHQHLFGRMKTQDWLTVLKDGADHGCKQVQFIGGEPTMHPDLSQMISVSSSLNYTLIEVFTNATMLNEQLIRTFKEHNVRIATSFYSDDPNIHDSITTRRGSFARTVKGIKRVLEAEIPIRVGIIEMQENVGHALRAKHFLEEIGVSDIKIDFQRGVGRGTRAEDSVDQMAQLCGECWKGKLCVTALGRVYPCVFARFVDLGSVRNGIDHIVVDDMLLEFRTTLKNYRADHNAMADAQLATTTDDFSLIGCNPNTCSPCNPQTFTLPMEPCSPLRPCSPLSDPCSPDRRCSPLSDPCSPDRPCSPQSDICLPSLERTCTP